MFLVLQQTFYCVQMLIRIQKAIFQIKAFEKGKSIFHLLFWGKDFSYCLCNVVAASYLKCDRLHKVNHKNSYGRTKKRSKVRVGAF